MTISSTTRVVQYVGPTVATFGFAFKVFEKADLTVIRTNLTTGIDTILTLTTDYTVTLNADQNYNAGGTITLTAGNLAAGYKLTITTNIDNLQPTDLSNQGGFYPDVINNSLDRATIQIQQLHDTIGRAMTSSVSDDPTVQMQLPSAVTRANKYLAFDASGLPIAATGTNTPGVSFPGEVDIVSNNGGTNSPTARDIVFKDNTTELARIKGATGFFGIGTNAAANNLQIHQSGAVNCNLTLTNGTSGSSATDGLLLRMDSVGQGFVYNMENAGLLFGTAGFERMRINSSGNVGIGTSDTPAKLNVYTTTATDGITLKGNNSRWITVGINATGGDFNSLTQTNDRFIAFGSTGPDADTAGLTIVPHSATTSGIRIDNTGKVGIGAASPSNKLHVDFGNATAGSIQLTNGTTTGTSATDGFQMRLDSSGAAYVWNYENTAMLFGTAGSERMRIDNAGNVGVGVTPAAFFHVNGTIRYTNRPANGTITAIGYDTNGDLRAATSSLRYKHDVQDYTRGLADIAGLRPVSFAFNGETRHNAGFIAEEIDALGMHELMLYDEQGRPDGVLYANMVAMLTKGIQELKALVDAQAARIAALEAKP